MAWLDEKLKLARVLAYIARLGRNTSTTKAQKASVMSLNVQRHTSEALQHVHAAPREHGYNAAVCQDNKA